MPEVFMVQGDRKPSVEATLTNCGDLTGASAKFIMIKPDGTVKVNSSALISDPANKKVRYDWASGETGEPGDFYGEFEVTYADGTKQSFPAKPRTFTLHIRSEHG